MSKKPHANTCAVCGRGYNKANSRSHSNIATTKRQKVNLQKVKYQGVRVEACTKCIKTLAKKAA